MTAHRIANRNHEDVARYTSRDFGGRPLPRTLRGEKRYRNRVAKRAEKTTALRESGES